MALLVTVASGFLVIGQAASAQRSGLAPAGTGGVVYLRCVTNQNGTNKLWDITLNEAAGSVDYYTEISGQQRAPARFTAEAVYFIGFTLSRVNLTIQRMALGDLERGSCQLAQPKARAF